MNSMAPVVYQCVVCQLCVISINELHAHHMENHTIEELSNAIINLRGFRCVQLSSDHFMTDYSSSVIYSNFCNTTAHEANSETLFKIVLKEEQPDNLGESTNVVSPKIDIADTEEFKTWEHELNKNIAISEEDFLQCVTALCNDLAKKKHKVNRHKGMLKRCNTDTGNKENICVSTETVTDTMVGKDFEGTSAFQPTVIANDETIQILCNTISEDVYNASLLQNSNTGHESSETPLVQSYLISSDITDAHISGEEVAINPDTFIIC